jgi:hypothetical protein
MTAHEGGDEDLIFLVQTGELGQLEAALDGDVFFGEADTLDHHGLALGQVR